MPRKYRSQFRLIVAFGLPLLGAVSAAAPSPSTAPAREAAPPAANGENTSGERNTLALVVDGAAAQTLLGLPVRTSKREDLGHVVDVIVDRNGALMAAIVDFGGFLGVGSRKIAVDWRILHFPKTGALNGLVADLSRDQLRNAPEFKPGEPIVIMGAPALPPTDPTPTATPTPAASTP
jgi:hypothetical protein